MDIEFDWLLRRYEIDLPAAIAHIEDVTKTPRSGFVPPATLEDAGDPNTLNEEQRDVFDTVLDNCLLPKRAQRLLRVHLDGVAGTSKPRLIDMISSHTAYYARKQVVLRAAPTGVAAHHIHGATLHQLLAIAVNKTFVELGPERLAILQDVFRNIELLIIDDKSMIGLRFISWIDRRLRQIQATPDTPFGGLNLLFCGDFGQLAPVMDTPLYQPLSGSGRCSEDQVIGKHAYSSIDTTKTLVRIMRQQVTSADDVQFRELLDELREGPISLRRWHFFIGRTKGVMPEHEWGSLKDALRIYFTKARVQDFNLERLEQLHKPVLRIKARNSCSKAKEAPTDIAGNLANELMLCEGAKIMLSWNLWTEQGLVNGRTGYTHSILWDDTATDCKTTPAMIMVDFSYCGPASVDIDGTPVIPILPRHAQWDSGSTICTRTQFPLQLAFAITVPKSQGLTLDKAVLNLTDSDFTTAQLIKKA